MKRKILLTMTVLLLQNTTHPASNNEILEAARNAMIQLDLDFDNEKDLKYAITLILMENTQHDWGRKSVLTRTEQSQLKTLAQALIETKILNAEDQEIINHYLQTPLQEQTPKAIAEKAATTKKEGSVEWYLKKFNDAKTEQLAAAGAISLPEMIELRKEMLKVKNKQLKVVQTKRADKKNKNKVAFDNEIGALNKFIANLEKELNSLRTDQGKKTTEQRTAEKAATTKSAAPSLQPRSKPSSTATVQKQDKPQSHKSTDLSVQQQNLLKQTNLITTVYPIAKHDLKDELMPDFLIQLNLAQPTLQKELLLLENKIHNLPSQDTNFIINSPIAPLINSFKNICDFDSEKTQAFLITTFNTLQKGIKKNLNRKNILNQIHVTPCTNDRITILKYIILILVQVVGDFNLIQKIFSTLDWITEEFNDPTEEILSSAIAHFTTLLKTPSQTIKDDVKSALEQEIIPVFKDYLLGDKPEMRKITNSILYHMQIMEIAYNENNMLMLEKSLNNLNEFSLDTLPRINLLRSLIKLYLTTLTPDSTNKTTIDALFTLLKTDTRAQFSTLTKDDIEELAHRIFKFLSEPSAIEQTDEEHLQNVLLLTDDSFIKTITIKDINQLSLQAREQTLRNATTALNEAGKENKDTAIALASIKSILNWSGTWNPSTPELLNPAYLLNQVTLLQRLSELAQHELMAQYQEEQTQLEENLEEGDELSISDSTTI